MARFIRMVRPFAVAFLCLAAGAAANGCRTSTRSGLPDHIRDVEVEVFANKTMYKGLEGRLTRAVIDRVNADPRIRVSSGGGDAVITGEITDVRRSAVRETTTDEPATVSLTIYATFSLYDLVENRYIMEDVLIVSSDSIVAAGLYEVARGESVSLAEAGAVDAVARDIVRRSVGMW